MGYVECARCGLTAYTAVCWSTIDDRVRCGAPLPHRSKGHADCAPPALRAGADSAAGAVSAPRAAASRMM
jgi:hypothetical protein